MKLHVASAIVALTVGLTLSAAHAETSTLVRAGSWEAFGGTTNTGRPVCGVSRDVESKYFGLKLYSGDATFTIQVGAKDWKITDGAKFNVVLTFDTRSPWNGPSTGMHFSDGDAGLEFTIKKDQIDLFMTEFRGSNQLRVQFQNATLADWTLGLSGSNAVSEAFLKCNRGLK